MRRSLGGVRVFARAHTHTYTRVLVLWSITGPWFIYIYIYTRVLQFQNLFQLQVQKILFFLMYLPPSIFGIFWGFPNFSTMYVCSVQNCTLPYWFYLQHIGSHNDSEFVVSSIITNIIRYLSRSYYQVYWKPQYWLHIGSISSSCLSKPSYNGTFMAKIW